MNVDVMWLDVSNSNIDVGLTAPGTSPTSGDHPEALLASEQRT